MGTSAFSSDVLLPEINTHYTTMDLNPVKGRTFSEIVIPKKLRLIALTKNCGIGAPFTSSYKPQFDPTQLFDELCRSQSPAQQWGLSATEVTLAEFTVVSDDGRLFIIEVLQDMQREVPVSGVLLRGDGIGCRFPFSDTFKASSTSTR